MHGGGFTWLGGIGIEFCYLAFLSKITDKVSLSVELFNNLYMLIKP